AVDGDVPGTVKVDSVGAGSLPVVVRHLETYLADGNAVAIVDMEIPELRILERDALDLHVARALNERQAGAGNTHIREVPALRRRVAQFPEQVPYWPACSIKRPFAGELEAIAFRCVDQSRIALLLEVALDPGALGGKVRHIRRALQHCSRLQAKIHPRLEEHGAAHERALRDDDRSSAARCQMIDRRLD